MSFTNTIRTARRGKAAVPLGGALAAVIILAGWGSSSSAGANVVAVGQASPESATATTIKVTGGEFYFKLSSKSLAKPGKVTFTFRNAGHVLHDFKINGKKTPLIQPGKTARLVVTFKKKGKYAYLCTVPGHAAAGMKGVFTVR